MVLFVALVFLNGKTAQAGVLGGRRPHTNFTENLWSNKRQVDIHLPMLAKCVSHNYSIAKKCQKIKRPALNFLAQFSDTQSGAVAPVWEKLCGKFKYIRKFREHIMSEKCGDRNCDKKINRGEVHVGKLHTINKLLDYAKRPVEAVWHTD